MEGIDTPPERGALRGRRRAAGVAALAAATLLVAGSAVTLLALRAARVHEAVRAIHDAGGLVTWDYEVALLFDDTFPPEQREALWTAVLDGGPRMDPNRDGRAWLRRLLGTEWLQDVAAVQFFPSSELKGASPFERVDLAAFPRLKHLDLIGVQSTDRTLEIAGGLRDLERLTVQGDSVSDEGLRHLGSLSRLQDLDVQGALITDAGVLHLTVLDKLESLALRGTQITDRGATALLELKSLKSLTLDGTHITENGIEMLRAMLPGVQVSR
jgi:hypothetical protein